MDDNSLWEKSSSFRPGRYISIKIRNLANPSHYKVAFFSFLTFLLSAGHSIAFFSADSLLISRVGVKVLFYAYFLESILFLFLISLFFKLSRRFGRARTFQGTAILFGLIVLFYWVLIRGGTASHAVFFSLAVLTGLINSLTILGVWALVGSGFNAFEAKRFNHLILSFGILGRMVGDSFVIFGVQKIHALNLLLIWSGLLLALPIFILVVEWLTATFDPQSQGSAPSRAKIGQSFRAHSRFVLFLFGFWALFNFFMFGVDFIFNASVARSFSGEDSIALYFAEVGVCSSFAVLLYQVFISRSLMEKIGIERMVFLIPLFSLASWALVRFFPSLLSVAVAQGLVSYFANFLSASVMSPILQVFPVEDRGNIEELTEGLGKPLGTLLLLGLAAVFLLEPSINQLSTALVLGPVFFIIFPFIFRRLYLKHLMASLHSDDPDLVSNAIDALGERNKSFAVVSLLGMLEKSDDIALKRTIVNSLGKIGSSESFPALVNLLSTPNISLRLCAIQALANLDSYESISELFQFITQDKVSSFLRSFAMSALTKAVGGKMIPFLMESLQDENPVIRGNAVESIGMLKDPKSVPILLPFLFDQDHRVRANAIIALYPLAQARKEANRSLSELYYSKDDELRCSAIFAIGMLRLKKFKEDLLSMMVIPSKKVLTDITTTLARMKNFHFYGTFVRLLLDPDEEFGLEVAKKLYFFPRESRMLVFEEISKLPEEERKLVNQRLDAIPYDFSAERRIPREVEVTLSHSGSRG